MDPVASFDQVAARLAQEVTPLVAVHFRQLQVEGFERDEALELSKELHGMLIERAVFGEPVGGD